MDDKHSEKLEMIHADVQATHASVKSLTSFTDNLLKDIHSEIKNGNEARASQNLLISQQTETLGVLAKALGSAKAVSFGEYGKLFILILVVVFTFVLLILGVIGVDELGKFKHIFSE